MSVALVEVTADNWRSVARVRPTEVQLDWLDPTNEVARVFYRSLGFAETGETDDDELVMRRPTTPIA